MTSSSPSPPIGPGDLFIRTIHEPSLVAAIWNTDKYYHNKKSVEKLTKPHPDQSPKDIVHRLELLYFAANGLDFSDFTLSDDFNPRSSKAENYAVHKGLAFHKTPVLVVHGRNPDLQQDFIAFGGRFLYFFEPENIGGPVLRIYNCLHKESSVVKIISSKTKAKASCALFIRHLPRISVYISSGFRYEALLPCSTGGQRS